MVSVPVDLRERMEVLFWQEMSSYKTEDYLAMFYTQRGTPNLKFSDVHHYTAGDEANGALGSGGPMETIKEHWREIICEWAYNCEYQKYPTES